jgi:hypothetical protein
VRLFSLLIIIGFFSGQPAFADDANGNHAVWGIGQESCHAFGKARAAGEVTEYKSYLMGYLTACNILIPETYNITGARDLNGVLSWLDEHCGKNPMDSFDRALGQMVSAFRDSRLTKAPAGPSWGRPPSIDVKK